MRTFKIVLEQAADLPIELYTKDDFEIIPMGYHLDDVAYLEDAQHSQMSLSDFYKAQREGSISKTSQVTLPQFLETFDSLAKAGYDILHISLASTLSGTYNSAVLAGREVMAIYPEATIISIDSYSASMGIGILALEALRQQQAGKSLKDVADWLEKHKMYAMALFTVDDLNHLKRGGRISATNAAIGSLLSIKPLLTVSHDGTVIPIGKSRGRKTAQKKLVQEVLEDPYKPQDFTCFVGHCDSVDDAQAIKEMLEAEKVFKDVKIFEIGSVIGSHVGPGTIGVLFFGKNRQ